MRTGQELTTAETVIASALELRLGSLALGRRHLISLEQIVSDGSGGWKPGPHPVGWGRAAHVGRVRVRLVSTEAGRTAAAVLEGELLDVALSRDYPPVVRLM